MMTEARGLPTEDGATNAEELLYHCENAI